MTEATELRRCPWASQDALYKDYHDREWGFPVDDDRRLFEKICLEGFQAGLSWLTILKKRENFRNAFSNFEIEKIARYDDHDIDRLLADAGIVRHRGKIVSTINNAQRAIELRDEFGTLASYFWSYEPDPSDRPTKFTWDELKNWPTSQASTRLSKNLKKRGWTFVGPTTVYAFMQAMGLVNDHAESCHCRDKAEAQRQSFVRP